MIQAHRQQILSSLGSLSGFPSGFFKTRVLGRGFHTLIKGVTFSSPTDVGYHNLPPLGPSVPTGTRSFLQSMWDPYQIHPPSGPAFLLAHRLVSTPLRGTTSSLAHHPVSGSDSICNGPSPPLVDIVLFRLSLSSFPLRFFKTRLLGRGFHTLIKGVSFSFQTDVGYHTSTISTLIVHLFLNSCKNLLQSFIKIISQELGVTLTIMFNHSFCLWFEILQYFSMSCQAFQMQVSSNDQQGSFLN